MQDGWDEVVGRLQGPVRGVLTGSEPVALIDRRLTVAVNPILLASATRSADEVASAIAETCALRVAADVRGRRAASRPRRQRPTRRSPSRSRRAT